jgi:hypothetical protein
LQRELRRDDYHVFHYIGHGGYDKASDDGVLVLEDGNQRSRLVSGIELGTILADETTLRLAVLNACEGARTSLSDPFSGVATSLVRLEIPAVIAMQLEITDRAAITFAAELYAALADGYAIDAALAEARKAIFADENEVEWATPVLFMRVPDGRIFDVAHPIGVHDPVPTLDDRQLEGPPDRTGELGPPLDKTASMSPRETTALVPSAKESALMPATETAVAPPSQEASSAEVVAARLPDRLLVALVACVALLGVGVLWASDAYDRVNSMLSPIAVVGVGVLATVLAKRGRLQLAAGMVVACGLAASAIYLGQLAKTLDLHEQLEGGALIPVFVLAGSFALIAIGIELARRAGVHLARRGAGGAMGGWVTRALLGASAFMILIGCVVEYTDSYGSVARDWKLVFPAAFVGVVLLIIAFCLDRLPRLFAAGLVLALGSESFALWVWLGSIAGLAGATLALGVGLWLALAQPEGAPAPTPAA